MQSLRDDAVRAARDAGASMPEIGAALGLSKQRVAVVLKAKLRETVERDVHVA